MTKWVLKKEDGFVSSLIGEIAAEFEIELDDDLNKNNYNINRAILNK